MVSQFYEYACANGKGFISTPGTLEEAKKVLQKNYDIAHQAGDRSRFDYHIVRRAVGCFSSGPWVRMD